MDLISLAAIILSLFFIGFYYGIEVAFASSNKMAIELQKKQGKHSGKTWAKYINKPSRFYATVLTGSGLFLIIYGLLAGKLLVDIWNWIEARLPQSAADYVKFIRLMVETFLSTIIILIVDYSLKAVFRAKTSQVIRSGFISYLFTFLSWLLAPITGFILSAAQWCLKYVLNVKVNAKKEILSKADPDQFIQHRKSIDSEGTPEINRELFENALSIGEVKLRECLIPRKEIEAVDLRTSIAEVRDKFIATQLSRIVVYDKNIDNITGYIHQLDLYKNPRTIQEVIHPIPMVPQSMAATDMMNKFSSERKSIAWVVDEFGGTAGIVTMEDLLEELFGEIKDEYDEVEEFVEKQISANEFILSGRLELDYLQKKYELFFSETKGAETLSGYIIRKNESIPAARERIIYDNYEFDVISVSATRIETVKVKVLK